MPCQFEPILPLIASARAPSPRIQRRRPDSSAAPRFGLLLDGDAKDGTRLPVIGIGIFWVSCLFIDLDLLP